MVTRPGFGLIEAIVAMTLLSVGLLALAATAGVAARITRESEAAERAAFQASQVMDSLSSLPDPHDGQATAGSVHLAWTVARSPNRVARILLSARFSDGTRQRTVRYAATMVLP